MTPQIKQRTDQLRRGEVPEGYKKTKYGIVPAEWEETMFSDLFTSTSDFTEDLDQYPLYSLTIENGITAKTDRYERSHLVKKENAYKIVRPNDFAYNPMNVRFGAVARHKGNIDVCVSGYYDIFTTKDDSDLEFMDSFLISDKMIAYYNRISIGSLVEKQRVHFSQFMDFRLPLPSPTERKKIAEILSAQDKLIALKEKLIEEKKRQKKYLMQQLLTGKKRLPGFSGEWVTSKIKGVTEISAGATPDTNNPEFWGGNIKWMSSGELNNKHIYDVVGRITEIGLSKTSTKLLPQKCVLIGLAGQGKTRGTAAINYTELCTNQSIAAVHPCDIWVPEFLYYCLDMRYDELRLISSGDGTRGGLNLKLIGDLIIKYPSYEEQESIAKVLTTADKELEIFQKDLDQEKQKKKALMQLLLSGVVRVNV